MPKDSVTLRKDQLMTLNEHIKYRLTTREETIFLLTISNSIIRRQIIDYVVELYNFMKTEVMEDNTNLFDSLLERASEYGKTSYELVKLKAVDKTSDVVSSFIPHSVVFVLIASFMLFLNLGLALWLGEILGKIFYGFFVVAGFYVLSGIVIHFFMHKWLKRIVSDYFIKHMLK